MRMIDPDLELVACGSSGPTMDTFGEWERVVLSETYELVDLISAHQYFEDFGDLRRALIEGELAATEAADSRVCPVRAEDPIGVPQLLSDGSPGMPAGGAVGVPAAQGDAHRHPHQVLDPANDAVVGLGTRHRAAHRPAWSRAACSDRR